MPGRRKRSFRPLSRSLFTAHCQAGILLLSAAGYAGAQTFTIDSTSTYATGNNPSAIIATGSGNDLNGDGYADLITAEFDDNTISVHLGNSMGGFSAPVSYAVGTGPVAMDYWRLNAGSTYDLAVANKTSSTVSVLFSNGDGTFTAATHYPTGLNPVNIDASSQAIRTTNEGDNTISILPGNGAGSYGAKVDVPAGNNPYEIQYIDGGTIYNAYVAFATVSEGDNALTILRELTECVPSYKRTDYPTGAGPRALAKADLDGDAGFDLVTANAGDNTISVFLNDRLGSFRPRTDYPAAASPVDIAVEDVNLDGHPDIVTANDASNSVSIYMGDGTGSFAPRVDIPTGTSPQSVAVRSIDRDGVIDIVTANAGSDDITLLRGNIGGTFLVGDTAAPFSALDQHGDLVSLADSDGKWRVIDLGAAWCAPCQVMGVEVQQVYDSWVGHPTVAMEYMSVLYDNGSSQSSRQIDAQAWATDYDISRSILHPSGNPFNNHLENWWISLVEANGANYSIPSVVFVDPAGVIRRIVFNSMTGQAINDTIAALAGIGAAPTLGPPPSAIPPFPPLPSMPLHQQAIATADIEVSYGAQTWNGSMTPSFTGTDKQIMTVFAPVPWMGVSLVVQAVSIVDTVSLEEGVTFTLSAEDYSTVPTALPWEVALQNITWPDGFDREMSTAMIAGTTTLHWDGGICYDYFDAQLTPAATFVSGDLAIDPIELDSVPVPVDPLILYLEDVRLKHSSTIVSVPEAAEGSTLRLLGASANPARENSQWQLVLPADAEVTLDVFDIAGRRVRSLWNGKMRAGRHLYTWDGRDDGNNPVASGVYLVRFAGGDLGTETKRVVWLR